MICCECGYCHCRSLWGPSFPCLCRSSMEEVRRTQQYQSGQRIYFPGEAFDPKELEAAQSHSVLSRIIETGIGRYWRELESKA